MALSTRNLIVALVVCISFLPLDVWAQDERRAADRTLSPYFFVEGGDASIDRLPLKETRVDVAITGVIADVTVRQVYENHGTRPLHARYVFPASTRAAVYGLTMTVGNVRTVATIKERQQAAREFEAAKREGKSASLLEQSRPNVFSMKVANVLPGDSIAVELRYTELLVPTDGVYEFVYPTVVGPRYSEKSESQASPGDEFVKAPYTRQGEAPRSEFYLAGVVSTGVPLQELASASHQVVVRSSNAGRADIVLADSERLSGNRDFILRYRLAGAEIASGLLLYQGRDENFFLLMAEPPQAVEPSEMPRREYIFVLDVSGSMYGFPLDTAKQLMTDLASVLRPSDVFNVVVFEPRFRDLLADVGRSDTGQHKPGAAVYRREKRWRRDPAPEWPPTGGRTAPPAGDVPQRRPGHRRLHRRGSGCVRLHSRTTRRPQRVRVRDWQQREPVAHRGRGARGTRRAVCRNGPQ